MPLTVEESKLHLYNDNRCLNLRIKDTPFKLDSLYGLPHFVTPSSFQSVCDEKSGYYHVLLSPESRAYFGFQWGGWFFTSNIIPLAGNPWRIFTILLGFSPLITFILFFYLACCTLMIATQGKSCYLSRLQPATPSPRNLRNPLLGHHSPFL